MLIAAEPDWPRLRVEVTLGDPSAAPEVVTADRAEIVLKTGGRLMLDRVAGTARFIVPRRLTDDELVHPFLAPAAAVMSFWHGRLSFHAGAFLHEGGVWGLVGAREAGKSSTLAWLALNGHDVVADDVLVLGEATAYSGPRSIDLRRSAAEQLGQGAALGVVGTRERWRVTLPQIGAMLPFRGWFFLSWSEREPEHRRLPSSECLVRLIDNIGLRMQAADPAQLLALAALPAWDLARPRDWNRMGESVECMLSLSER